MFNENENTRYSRHFILPGFGKEAQQKLKIARVLIVGAGGLGCPVLQYLAAAGVGTIGIIDNDTVSLSNLQRQVLFTVNDVGKPKVEVAKERLQSLNNEINIITYKEKLTIDNVERIFQSFDIIADGSDNFATRYLVNDACVLFNKINVFASILKYEGQVAVFNAPDKEGDRTSNYRDFFPKPPEPGTIPSCAEAGVIGVLAGIIGTMQANEIIKIITGIGEPLVNKVLLYNSLTSTSTVFNITKDEQNPLNYITSLNELKQDYIVLDCSFVPEITWQQLLNWKNKNKSFTVIDVRSEKEFDTYNIGGINIPLIDLLEYSSTLNKEKTLVVVCQSGVRSKKAVELLLKNGFTNVYNLKYGLQQLL
jgi:adenylyltransferase/sulfurtransferase